MARLLGTCKQLGLQGGKGGALSFLAASGPRGGPIHLALSTHPLRAHVRATPLPRGASAVKLGPMGKAGSLVQMTQVTTLNSGLMGGSRGLRALSGAQLVGLPQPRK